MKHPHYYFLINSLEGGGAERVTINSATALLKEGKHVYIITLKSCVFYDLPAGVTHIVLSHVKNNILMFLLIPWYALQFRRVCKKYALTDGMSLLEIANFVHIMAKKNATISFRTHVKAFTGSLGKIQVMLIKWLYPKAGKIIVNSLENKYESSRILSIPLEKIDVVYNTIDIEECKKLSLESLPEDLQQKIAGKKVFVTTGRLIGDKGFGNKHHDLIIKGLYTLYNTFDKNWVYIIVGDGPEKYPLEKLVDDLGLQEHILFAGMQKNVFSYLAAADIFLYASDVEGFPNVLVEAKSLGIPIITSDFMCGAQEVILDEYSPHTRETLCYPFHGKHGWLVDLGNYQKQLVTCIKTFYGAIAAFPRLHFTIITPTYNRKNLLEKSILSVLNQQWQDLFSWQMIIVDDGSTDGTQERMEQFLVTQPHHINDNILYIRQQNAGVGAARNRALDNMSPQTDYIIRLDSDDELIGDCIYTFLASIQSGQIPTDKEIAGIYFLCVDENGEEIGGERVLGKKPYKIFGYKNYLQGDINTELLFIVSAKLFLQEPHLRFPEDVITEGVMRSKMRKYMEEHNMSIVLYDYIGRLYRRYHTSFPSITKTVSPERCLKNAMGNERVLQYIAHDLTRFDFTAQHAEHLFRIGVNYILGGNIIQGRDYLKKSIAMQFQLRNIGVYLLSFGPLTLLRKIYSRYIRHE